MLVIYQEFLSKVWATTYQNPQFGVTNVVRYLHQTNIELLVIMIIYGVPKQIVDLIKETYRGYMCRVVHEDCVSEPFPVRAGVRQGCILSPLMFLVVIDAVMRNVNRDRRRGIRWGLVDRLEDLDFADDLCLLSEAYREMQAKLGDLTKEAGKVGLAIKAKKSKHE